ncbi:MAG: AAA family ATPase [Bacteroidia bacterium]
MIKIEEIKIKGYKNIESASLTFNNFNVIIGANNSGKSNFIQTISFLNYVINSSLDDVEKAFSNGFISTNFNDIIPKSTFDNILVERKGLISFELLFSNSETNRLFTYLLELDWSDEFLSDTVFKIKTEKLDVKELNKPGKSSIIFKREYERVKYGTEFSKMDIIEKIPNHFSVIRLLKIIAKIKDEYKDAIDSLNSIIRTPIFYFSHIELLKAEKERVNAFNGRVVSFELENDIISLESNVNWDIFKDALKSILRIEDVNVYLLGGDNKNEKIPKSKFIYFMHNKVMKSLNQFSDGTLLIIALITKILTSKNNLFLIEEPENSTHPKALIDLLFFLKSFSENVQFIITSHSIAILNKTKIEEIIASSINENGQSELFNVSSRKELKNKLKNSRVNFSDELFFNLEEKDEFE